MNSTSVVFAFVALRIPFNDEACDRRPILSRERVVLIYSESSSLSLSSLLHALSSEESKVDDVLGTDVGVCGEFVGSADGLFEGCGVGMTDGDPLGSTVGCTVGFAVGFDEGTNVG